LRHASRLRLFIRILLSRAERAMQDNEKVSASAA